MRYNNNRAWRTQFKNKKAPADSTINNLMKKFNHMGIVNEKPPKQNEMSKKRQNATNYLKELYSETPNLSFHKVAQILQVSSTLVRVTLNFDLKLNTYFQIWPKNTCAIFFISDFF